MNYGLVLISHSEDKTFTDENGTEYNQIVPTLDKRGRKICTRLCDIIGYSRSVLDPETGKSSTKLFMRGTPRYVAGSRFPYTPDSIEFTYNNLVKAINDSIDRQANEGDSGNFTDERVNLYKEEKELDYVALKEEFNALASGLMVKNKELYGRKIPEITNRILGKGKKFSDCTESQVELMDLVLQEMRELSAKEKGK